MSALPSIYSSEGLSSSDRRKVITTGKPRSQRPIGAIKLESRVNNAIDHNENFDHDGDIPMLGMDDENEVQLVTDYVLDKRNASESWGPSPTLPTDLLAQSERDLTPEEKPNKDTIMVIDTNFIISHLDILDELTMLHKKYHHQIIIPTTVIRELDGLKLSKKKPDDSVDGTTIGHLARWANDWIYKRFAESDSSVRGQKLKEVLDYDARKDDAILDCCLYFHQKQKALVILLSNDKNLCTKALTNDILTVSYRKGMSAELIAKISFVENKTNGSTESVAEKPTEDHVKNSHIDNYQDAEMMDDDHYSDYEIEIEQHDQYGTPKISETSKDNHLITIDDFDEAVRLIHREVQILVLDAIDHCMYEEYGDDLELIGYEKSEIATLRDSANSLIKYWMTVFTEYFNRDFYPYKRQGKKKFPINYDLPKTEFSLDQFVSYWSNVLKALYSKRDSQQNSALDKIIERWENISKAHQ